MAYRRTSAVAQRLDASRASIVAAATQLVTEHGYAGAGPAAVAQRAGVATGTVYRHFASKADLLTEVFRTAAARELAAVTAAADAVEPERPHERISAVVETFARRALRSGRLAYALLAEPVDPAVEATRLEFRAAYHQVLARVVSDGVRAGALPLQDARVTAAAVVGAIAEPLVGPLARQQDPSDVERLVASICEVCRRAVGTTEGST